MQSRYLISEFTKLPLSRFLDLLKSRFVKMFNKPGSCIAGFDRILDQEIETLRELLTNFTSLELDFFLFKKFITFTEFYRCCTIRSKRKEENGVWVN